MKNWECIVQKNKLLFDYDLFSKKKKKKPYLLCQRSLNKAEITWPLLVLQPSKFHEPGQIYCLEDYDPEHLSYYESMRDGKIPPQWVKNVKGSFVYLVPLLQPRQDVILVT
jgi:hypothetical protein